MPQELAHLANSLVQDRFPRAGGYKTFLSNSGTEAIEAGLKLATLSRYRIFIEKYGSEVFDRVCSQLGIRELTTLNDSSVQDKLYNEYPMFVIAFKNGFHGRTLGSLMGTMSKKCHLVGFPKGRFYGHLTFNGDPAELSDLLDSRPITEILDAPGGVAAVIESGRIPVDLAAVLIGEVFQGEGGYRCGDRRFFASVRETLDQHGIFFLVDEVQSFARTGKLFCVEHMGIAPDIIALAKGAFVGITIGPGELERYLHTGWHSNTWGGGRLFETNMAYETLDLLENHRDPLFCGLSFMENEKIKGKYLDDLLGRIQRSHPDILLDFEGLGLMYGFTVSDRDRFVAAAWDRGLKFLGTGTRTGAAGRVRLLMLADTLTREIEDLAVNLDHVLEEM